MPDLDLLFYVDAQGGAPFETWFRDLDVKAQAKIAVALDRLKHGGAANVAGVGESILELKLDWGPGYRIYFGRDGDRIVLLLCGGAKKRQSHDIARAKRFWVDYIRASPRGELEEERAMPLTRNFNDLVKSRVKADPAFRQALFQEAVQTMLDGDVTTAKSVLRDYINATIGFERLSLATQTPAKSLMRMFGRQGNPTAANLLGVISVLQKQTGVHLEVAAVANAA